MYHFDDPEATPGDRDLNYIFSLVFGYRATMALFAATELDVFNRLRARPATAAEVAGQVGSHAPSTELLLDACVGLGLLEKSAGRYANTPLAERFFDEGSPTYLGNHCVLQIHNFRNWASLPETIRTNQPPAEPPPPDPLRTRRLALAYYEAAATIGEKMHEGVDIGGCRSFLGVGPRTSTYAVKLARQYPELQARILVKSASHLEMIREKAAEAGLQHRVAPELGDLQSADLGQGLDVVWLESVLMGYAPGVVPGLLARAYGALRPGGTIVIGSYMVDETRTRPAPAALFAMNSLMHGEDDRATVHSTSDYCGWLVDVGFRAPEVRPQPWPRPVMRVLARKPD